MHKLLRLMPQKAEQAVQAPPQAAAGADAGPEEAGPEDFAARMRSAAVAKRKAMEPSPLVSTPGTPDSLPEQLLTCAGALGCPDCEPAMSRPLHTWQ